ncbi:hypothetical protein [Azospirillum sp. sgz302134]
MKTNHSDRKVPDDDWVGAYGFGGHHGPGYEPAPGETRDAWDRAADSFLALIGDEDAERRLHQDHVHAAAPAGQRRHY